MKNNGNGKVTAGGGKKEYESLRFGEYNGNPLLVFGDPASKFPFSFGKAKARLVLAAVRELGSREFQALLEQFAEEK